MSFLFAVVVMALIGAMVFMVWLFRRRTEERERAEQARAAAFLSELAGAPKAAEAAPPHAPVPHASPSHAPAHVAVPRAPVPHAHNDLALQKLLFEAAHKAGEANEPVLAIQLYARLLVRYPATSFAEPARAAAAALKKKLVKS